VAALAVEASDAAAIRVARIDFMGNGG